MRATATLTLLFFVLLPTLAAAGQAPATSDPAATAPRPASDALECSRRAVAGGPLCVCGAAIESFRLGDRWLGALGQRQRMLLVPADLEPGSQRLERAADGAACEVEVMRLEARLDRERLWTGGGTELRLVVEGSSQPVEIRLRNRTPQVIAIDGGDDQVVTTSGGDDNAVERTVRGLRRGDFGIDWQALPEPCLCDGSTAGADAEAEEAVAEDDRDAGLVPWLTAREAREWRSLETWIGEKDERLAALELAPPANADDLAALEGEIARLENDRDELRARWREWRERLDAAMAAYETAGDRWMAVRRDASLTPEGRRDELDRLDGERHRWRQEVQRLQQEKAEAQFFDRLRHLDGAWSEKRRQVRERRRAEDRWRSETENLRWNRERLGALSAALEERAGERRQRLEDRRAKLASAARGESAALDAALLAAEDELGALARGCGEALAPEVLAAFDRRLADYLEFVARYVGGLGVAQSKVPEARGVGDRLADWLDDLSGARRWIDGTDLAGGAGSGLQALGERLTSAPLPVDLVRVPGELYRLLQSLLRPETREGLRVLVEGLGYELAEVDAWSREVTAIRRAHEGFIAQAEGALELRRELRREVLVALELFTLAEEQRQRLAGVDLPELTPPHNLAELEGQLATLRERVARLEGEGVELGWLEETLERLRASRDRLLLLGDRLAQAEAEMTETRQALEKWSDAVRRYFADRLGLSPR